MRALIVGLGSIGRRHARNWSALGFGQLAICHQYHAPQPEPLGVEAREYHDLDRALQLERPEIVLVTNPTSLHVSTAQRAVAAGAHVLIEKPLGCSLEGVDQLFAKARARGKALRVAYNLRFHPGLARMKALVEQAAIGRVLSARAEVGEYLPDWHPWEDYRVSYSGRRDLGGGAVLTFSHELDALCWLLGAPRAVTAVAQHASSLDIDTEDLAEIILEFESGVLGSLHADYLRRPPRRILELVGENGVLRWDYHQHRLEHYTADTGQWRIEQGDPTWTRNQMYVDELRAFVDGVRAHPPQSDQDGRQGAAVLAIALAALRAAAQRRTIDLHAEDDRTREWLSSFMSQSRA
ncbi:MAG: Gfo/Idh/MocA family oxidoreductase [Chloroflexi bacterium]|nr:Gfo/Idh/MocA family oxidoreductase [Chloroflexota bacterium]MBV9601835.1 Gfo/Idh/MocA family oxidoreductase [Chloroflexota bacterium]